METHREHHSITRPSAEHEVPQAPVRDDEATGPTEDLDRQPDGVPHGVIGATAFIAVVLAMVVAFTSLSGGTAGHFIAVLLALVAVPVIVSLLRKKADRDRDHVHPSR